MILTFWRRNFPYPTKLFMWNHA